MSLSAYSEKYDVLSNREKVLVLLSSMGLIIALLFLLVIEPQFKAMTTAKSQLNKSQSKSSQLQLQSAELEQKLSQEPKVTLTNQIEDLNSQKTDLQADLSEQSLTVISATAFTDFMAKILATEKDIKIEDVQVESQAYAGEDEDADTDDSTIVKQNITLNLQADNESIRSYLQFLENQAVNLAWDSIEYQTSGKDETNLIISFHLFSAKE